MEYITILFFTFSFAYIMNRFTDLSLMYVLKTANHTFVSKKLNRKAFIVSQQELNKILIITFDQIR